MPTEHDDRPRGHYAANRLSDDIKTHTPTWLDRAGYDRSRLVLFTHVPKTGGTSLKHLLARVYGRHFTDHHPTMKNIVDAVDDGRVASDDILAISSHQPYGYHRRIDGLSARRQLPFTVLRDPIDRMISYYNFVTTFRPHRLHQRMKDLDINEFFTELDAQSEPEISNSQCRLVSGKRSRSFADARDVLEQDYFAYAALADLDQLTEQLRSALGWPEVDEGSGHANKSPRRAGKDSLDSAVHERLIELNEQDDLLYRHLASAGAVVRVDWVS